MIVFLTLEAFKLIVYKQRNLSTYFFYVLFMCEVGFQGLNLNQKEKNGNPKVPGIFLTF